MSRADLLMLKGVISELPPEQQHDIATAEEALRDVLAKHGDNGLIAFAKVGLEEEAKTK